MPEIRVNGGPVERGEDILTPEALAFVAALQEQLGARRDELLELRRRRRAEVARTHASTSCPKRATRRQGTGGRRRLRRLLGGAP